MSDKKKDKKQTKWTILFTDNTHAEYVYLLAFWEVMKDYEISNQVKYMYNVCIKCYTFVCHLKIWNPPHIKYECYFINFGMPNKSSRQCNTLTFYSTYFHSCIELVKIKFKIVILLDIYVHWLLFFYEWIKNLLIIIFNVINKFWLVIGP